MLELFTLLGTVASIAGIPLAVFFFLRSRDQKSEKIRQEIVRALLCRIGEGRQLSLFEVGAVIRAKTRSGGCRGITALSVIEDLVSEIVTSPLLARHEKSDILYGLYEIYDEAEGMTQRRRKQSAWRGLGGLGSYLSPEEEESDEFAEPRGTYAGYNKSGGSDALIEVLKKGVNGNDERENEALEFENIEEAANGTDDADEIPAWLRRIEPQEADDGRREFAKPDNSCGERKQKSYRHGMFSRIFDAVGFEEEEYEDEMLEDEEDRYEDLKPRRLPGFGGEKRRPAFTGLFGTAGVLFSVIAGALLSYFSGLEFLSGSVASIVITGAAVSAMSFIIALIASAILKRIRL